MPIYLKPDRHSLDLVTLIVSESQALEDLVLFMPFLSLRL